MVQISILKTHNLSSNQCALFKSQSDRTLKNLCSNLFLKGNHAGTKALLFMFYIAQITYISNIQQIRGDRTQTLPCNIYYQMFTFLIHCNWPRIISTKHVPHCLDQAKQISAFNKEHCHCLIRFFSNSICQQKDYLCNLVL